jgi:hypothetical protein
MFLYTGPEAMYLAKNGFINPTKPESLNWKKVYRNFFLLDIISGPVCLRINRCFLSLIKSNSGCKVFNSLIFKLLLNTISSRNSTIRYICVWVWKHKYKGSLNFQWYLLEIVFRSSLNINELNTLQPEFDLIKLRKHLLILKHTGPEIISSKKKFL